MTPMICCKCQRWAGFSAMPVDTLVLCIRCRQTMVQSKKTLTQVLTERPTPKAKLARTPTPLFG